MAAEAFGSEGPLMYQARMTLPDADRGPYDENTCAGSGLWGVKEFDASELGIWMDEAVPDAVVHLSKEVEAYLFFPEQRFVVFWASQESDWSIVGFRALEWCETSEPKTLMQP